MSILTPIKGRNITHIKLNIINQVGSSLIQGNDILGNHIIVKNGGGEGERDRDRERWIFCSQTTLNTPTLEITSLLTKVRLCLNQKNKFWN